MPFDGKNFSETKPDVLSLAGLVAWLETQDPEERYNFMNFEGMCLIGQYMAAHGEEWNCRNYVRFTDTPVGESHRFGSIAVQYPHTFGGALERAKALLK